MRVIYLNQKNEKNDEECLVFEKEECCVKWFSLRDGYGFVFSSTVLKLKNMDIFLHYSKINQENSSRKHLVKPGDTMICNISQGSKGPQVEKIHEYFPLAKPPISGVIKCHGVIKWFNIRDDFGFIKPIKFIKESSDQNEVEELDLNPKDYADKSKEFLVDEEIEENLISLEKKNEEFFEINKNLSQEDFSKSNNQEKFVFGDKDIFIPGKKILLMGIEKLHLVPGRKCICYFRIDEQYNRICEKILFEE